MFCAIWHHFYNLKNLENTYGGVTMKVTLLLGWFSRFLICAIGTRSRKVYHMINIYQISSLKFQIPEKGKIPKFTYHELQPLANYNC